MLLPGGYRFSICARGNCGEGDRLSAFSDVSWAGLWVQALKADPIQMGVIRRLLQADNLPPLCGSADEGIMRSLAELLARGSVHIHMYAPPVPSTPLKPAGAPASASPAPRPRQEAPRSAPASDPSVFDRNADEGAQAAILVAAAAQGAPFCAL
jgi:hypothetical protein